MLTWEGVEAAGLRVQGWSISAIARHLGKDRKTVRRYLADPDAREGCGPDVAPARPNMMAPGARKHLRTARALTPSMRQREKSD
jgi:transposase